MSEMVTTPVASGIINAKFRELLYRRDRSAGQIELFQNQFFEDARAIREVINSGERTFDESLVLLEKAKRFKEWLRTRNPDGELLREYYKSATADSWIDKLPAKSVRFVITTLGGIGADMLFPTGGLGTTLGMGMGALDSFFLDRFLKGWRPNQFIEGPLRNFTTGAKDY